MDVLLRICGFPTPKAQQILQEGIFQAIKVLQILILMTNPWVKTHLVPSDEVCTSAIFFWQIVEVFGSLGASSIYINFLNFLCFDFLLSAFYFEKVTRQLNSNSIVV